MRAIGWLVIQAGPATADNITEASRHMEETAPSSSPSPKAPWWRRGASLVCAGAALFAATEYLAAAWLNKNPYIVRIPLGLLVLLGVAGVLIIAGALVRAVYHWIKPVSSLRRALEEIRNGKLAIDQLPAHLGALDGLRPVLLQILRDLRQQKSEVATLQHEMCQRVAQRTNALQRQIGSLRAQATHDPLTGLCNRRMLDESLPQIVQECLSNSQPMALLMIDVDDFKVLNDSLGHSAGDALLRSVGQLIRSTIRQDDCAFRCGGDEFVITLPRCGRAEAEALARRLMDLVDALSKTLPLSRKPRLAIGVAAISEIAPPGAPQLLEAADRHLYAIKAQRKQAHISAA